MRFSIFERHPREELSGYLDNELIPLRVEAVKAHLSSCPTCRAELDALRNLKSQLAALPEASAPRSFALTPQMSQRPAPEPARVRPPARVAALSNGMRLAGAGMAVALTVVMVLNFSGSGSDSTRDNSVSAPEVLIANSTTQYADAFTPAQALPSVAATSAPNDQVNTDVPPEATPFDGVASDGVGDGPSAGGGGVSSGNDGSGVLPSGTTPTFIPGGTTAPLPQTGNEVVPSTVPGASDPTDGSALDAGEQRLDTEDDLTKSLEDDQAAPEAVPTTAGASDSDGIDILLLGTIALAAGVVLAFAGSVLIPRIARDEL